MATANVEPSDLDLLQAEERIIQEHRDALEQQQERMNQQLLQHEHQQRVQTDMQQHFMAETTRGMQTLVARVSEMESRLLRGTDASRKAHLDAVEQQEERIKKELLEHEHQQRVAVDLQQQFMAETTRGMQTLVLRVSAMESRQCSSLGRGTDASRMAEAYARGESANLSTNSVDSLVEAMVASNNHRAVAYDAIFGEQDMLRAEHEVFLVFEQFILNKQTAPRSASNTSHSAESMTAMPMMRARFARAQENRLRQNQCIMPLEKFIEDILPSLSDQLMCMHELMLPVDKKFQALVYDEDKLESRHQLRRMSLCSAEADEGYAHPFEQFHFLSDLQLRARIPWKIRQFMDFHRTLAGIANPREQFSRFVTMQNDWYEDKLRRNDLWSNTIGAYEARQEAVHPAWSADMREMDRVVMVTTSGEVRATAQPRDARDDTDLQGDARQQA